jgi:SAM-dependent methyltransferase
MRREVEALWEFHQKRLKPGTPVARLRDRVAFSQDPPWRLVACDECGLLYRNPVERAFEVESIYARDCPSSDLLRALHATQRRSYEAQAERLGKMLPRGATVVEVGSYVGAFLAAARDAGLQAIGVDINPAVNRFTRSIGLDARDGELADLDVDAVDAIVIWNTFDQLSDPRATARAALTRLKPGGLLAIRVPNGAFYRRMRRGALRGVRRAILAHNNLLTFPYRWGFTPASLGALLGGAGFREAGAVGDVLVPTTDEWTRGWAAIEEWMVKAAMRLPGLKNTHDSPWFEIYVRASEGDRRPPREFAATAPGAGA